MTGIIHWAPLTDAAATLCGAPRDPNRDIYAQVCERCEILARARDEQTLRDEAQRLIEATA